MDNPRSRNTLVHQWDNLPELDAVRVFAAVAELKSFRGAASALGVPRSTVSRRLASLEGALKMRLVQRTTRQVALTDAGESFLKQIAPALAMIRDAGRGVLDATAEPSGLLRITATPGIAERVGELLLELLERYPRLRVELDLTDRILDLVAEGYDIAIRAGALADSSLMARTLGQAQGGYYCSPSYLAGRKKPRVPTDLVDHECLVFSSSARGGRWRFRVGRKAVDVTVRGRFKVNHLPVMRAAAVRGHGIAWLPGPAATDDVAKGRLVPVLREFWPEPTPLQLIYPSARNLAPQVRAAIDLLAEALRVPS